MIGAAPSHQQRAGGPGARCLCKRSGTHKLQGVGDLATHTSALLTSRSWGWGSMAGGWGWKGWRKYQIY